MNKAFKFILFIICLVALFSCENNTTIKYNKTIKTAPLSIILITDSERIKTNQTIEITYKYSNGNDIDIPFNIELSNNLASYELIDNKIFLTTLSETGTIEVTITLQNGLKSSKIFLIEQNDIHQVTFRTYTNDESNKILVKKGEKVNEPSHEERPGYEFLGWYRGENKWSFDNMISENILLYEKWKAIEYTLTIKYNDNKTDDLVLKYQTDSSISVKKPYRTGYTLLNFYDDLPSIMPAHDVIIELNWAINEYTFTVEYLDNKTEDFVITLEYDSLVPNIEVPSREGYSFASFRPLIPERMPAEDLTIYVIWASDVFYMKENDYIVVYDLSDKTKGDITILDSYDKTTTKVIKDRAFENCTSLVKITIPCSITSIGEKAFNNCTNLEYIEFLGTKEEWNNITKGSFWNDNIKISTVHCVDGIIE